MVHLQLARRIEVKHGDSGEAVKSAERAVHDERAVRHDVLPQGDVKVGVSVSVKPGALS